MIKAFHSIWTLGLCLVGLVLTGCGDAEYEYSSRTCYFYFDNSTHQDQTLQTAMTPYSNTFVTITKTIEDGVQYIRFTSNQKQNTRAKFDAWDQKRTLILGMNNGIIVGFGSLSSPLTFYAFDLECPKCFIPEQIPVRSRPLSVGSDGFAECGTCHRRYNLNNGGYGINGEKKDKLERYRCKTTGPLGILEVF